MVYVWTFAAAETAPAAGWLVCQTQMQTFVVDRKQLIKTREFDEHKHVC